MTSQFVKYVKRFRTAALIASLAGVVALAAQEPQPPADTPAFEVASIKPNSSGDGRIMMQNQPGRYIATQRRCAC